MPVALSSKTRNASRAIDWPALGCRTSDFEGSFECNRHEPKTLRELPFLPDRVNRQPDFLRAQWIKGMVRLGFEARASEPCARCFRKAGRRPAGYLSDEAQAIR